MTPFEIEQRRAQRQLKCFQAAKLIQSRLGGKAGDTNERLEHVRIAALSAVAECRATMHALVVKGIATEREVQEFLDWGYDNLLDQLHGAVRQVQEVGRG